MNQNRFKEIDFAKQFDSLKRLRKKFEINDSFLEVEKEEIKYESVSFLKKNKNRVFTSEENKVCISLFNPTNLNSYTFTINNWVNV